MNLSHHVLIIWYIAAYGREEIIFNISIIIFLDYEMEKWLVMETNLFFQARQTREKYRLSDEIR